MAQRRRAASQQSPNAATQQAYQRARTRLAALRTGVTSFAILAGLACYVLLTQLGVQSVIAVVAGLIFALLARIAISSLLRDWLLHAARRQAERDATAGTPPATGPREHMRRQ